MEDSLITKAEKSLLARVRSEWLQTAVETKPVDEASIRAILGRLYAGVGKPSPRNILFFDSPKQISESIMALRLGGEPARSQVYDTICGEVRAQMVKIPAGLIDQTRHAALADVTSRWLRPSFSDDSMPELFHLEKAVTLVLHQIREQVRIAAGVGRRPWPFMEDFGQFDYRLASYDYLGRTGMN